MDLYIIRHAWAGHYGDPDWPDDGQRPLTPSGCERFALVVERLAEREFCPEIIATSPLVRCRQTADLVAAGVSADPRVIELDELLPGSDLDGLIQWTADQQTTHDQVAWVGHTPDVGRMAAALIGNAAGWIRFAKGATAAIRFDGPPQLSSGELRWLATAKLLGC